jgi:hypothetical protein
MKNIIPNIFHYIDEKLYNNEYTDIELYKYFSILSIFNINKPKKIFFHYCCNLPNGVLWNKLKNILNDKLSFIKVNIPNTFKNNIKFFFLKFKIILIYQILKAYGGIFIDSNTIFINPINDLLKYNFFKSKNNEIIGSEKESYMANKLIDFYYKNKDLSLFDEKFGIKNINNIFINNHLINNLNFNNNEEYVYDIIFKEIYDYSFSEYFHLVKNCYFFHLNLSEEKLNNINVFYIFNKISIYNLLVRNVLSYNLINNTLINYDFFSKNLELVNNIDIILWINLDNSIDRCNNMNNTLNNFKIENKRISAINGDKIKDIKNKYFFSENNIFPNYTNKEYAVLTSHLNTIEIFSKINSNEIKYNTGLICEDDLSLDFLKYWNCDFKTIIENAPPNWEIIMLGYFSLDLNFTEDYKKWNSEWSAISYLIKYDNLSEKIEKLKKDDKWICNEYDVMVSDNYIFSKFNTYVYKYPFFTFPNNNDSTFHKDHVDYHRIYKISNYIVHEKIYEEYI